MTDRDSTTRTRARTPGEEDYPPSTAVHRRVTDPTQSGTFGNTKCDARRTEANQYVASVCREQAGAVQRVGKAPSEMPSFQPYWGKPAVRNDGGDRGDVGIIRSPVRASIPPDWERGLVTASGDPGNGATAEPVRHRQTKGAATDMFDLQPPRHISTLRIFLVAARSAKGLQG